MLIGETWRRTKRASSYAKRALISESQRHVDRRNLSSEIPIIRHFQVSLNLCSVINAGYTATENNEL